MFRYILLTQLLHCTSLVPTESVAILPERTLSEQVDTPIPEIFLQDQIFELSVQFSIDGFYSLEIAAGILYQSSRLSRCISAVRVCKVMATLLTLQLR